MLQAGTDGFGHHSFLISACEIALSVGCEAAWRLWHRELLSQLGAEIGGEGNASVDGSHPEASLPLVRVIVDTLEWQGVEPALVRMLERVLGENERAVNPRLFLRAVFE
jgi:hypothetical protein